MGVPLKPFLNEREKLIKLVNANPFRQCPGQIRMLQYESDRSDSEAPWIGPSLASEKMPSANPPPNRKIGRGQRRTPILSPFASAVPAGS